MNEGFLKRLFKKALGLPNLVLSLLDRLGLRVYASPRTGVYVTKGDNLELFDKFMLSSYYEVDEIRRAYHRSLSRTGMEWSDNFSKQCRFHSLYQLVGIAIQNNGSHDFAECGCWKGHSTHLISSLLRKKGFDQEFHVFDSFEGGLSEISVSDRPLRKDVSERKVEATRRLFVSTRKEVEHNLSEFSFIRLHEGWIPDRFPDVQERKFSFVHLDIDLEQPYRDSLEFFLPRLVPNGVMFFDDYGLSQFPGASKVIDEVCEQIEHRFFMSLPTGGAFLIK